MISPISGPIAVSPIVFNQTVSGQPAELRITYHERCSDYYSDLTVHPHSDATEVLQNENHPFLFACCCCCCWHKYFIQLCFFRYVAAPKHNWCRYLKISSILYSQIWNYCLQNRVMERRCLIGLLASLETLLCTETIDKLDKHNRITPVNRELVAQGVGNVPVACWVPFLWRLWL